MAYFIATAVHADGRSVTRYDVDAEGQNPSALEKVPDRAYGQRVTQPSHGERGVCFEALRFLRQRAHGDGWRLGGASASVAQEVA
jgi:hypothetical protein